MKHILYKLLGWLLYFASYFAMTLGVGAVGGLIAFPMIGLFTHPELTMWDLAMKGASVGFRWALVWAGGVAIVLCFIQGYQRRRTHREAACSKSLKTHCRRD